MGFLSAMEAQTQPTLRVCWKTVIFTDQRQFSV